MIEQQHVEGAFGEVVEGLFKNFFQTFTAAKGDKTAEAAAEDSFRKNILHARHVRDRAIAALP